MKIILDIPEEFIDKLINAITENEVKDKALFLKIYLVNKLANLIKGGKDEE